MNSAQAMLRSSPMRWALLFALAFAFVLVPFFLFEDRITALLTDAVAAARGHTLTSSVLIALTLVADILLPVPSSLVSSFAGAALGFWAGTLTIWLGMNGGCLFGYVLGRSAGHAAMRGIVGGKETERAQRMLSGGGAVALVVTRAVPVLAETFVLGAGAARMPLGPFTALTTAANLAVALTYSAVGVLALSEGSFVLLFLGLAALPALGWLAWLRIRR